MEYSAKTWDKFDDSFVAYRDDRKLWSPKFIESSDIQVNS